MSNYLGPIILTPTTTASSTTVYTSLVMDLKDITRYSIQTIWGAGVTGTFDVQGSLDYGIPTPPAIPTWKSCPGVSVSSPAGLAGGQLIDVAQTGIPFIRVVYTNIGGSGTIEVLGHAKGL